MFLNNVPVKAKLPDANQGCSISDKHSNSALDI
jgi:hypothetical protein